MNLTCQEIPFHKFWRESNSASQMIHRLREEAWLPLHATSIFVKRLLEDSKGQLVFALERFWLWYFENTGDTKLDQFKADSESCRAYHERQIQDGELTRVQANRQTIQALSWLVFDESEYGELGSISGTELRECVNLGQILRA